MNHKEIKNIPSVMPFVIAGGICVVLSFILPMYKLWSYLVIGVAFIVMNIVVGKMGIFKDTVIEVEKPILFKNAELQEIVTLASSQIETLQQLSKQIEKIEMVEDIKGITLTTQRILEFVIDNENDVKRVRKYFRYYIDEIINMIKQYDEFEEDPLNIEHIRVSKEKIEKTLSNANTSFLKFYNDLYEGKAMDINVDVKVFEGMLQEMK